MQDVEVEDEGKLEAEYLSKQKLKAALHYFVGKICESESKNENIPPIKRSTISTLTELAFGFTETLGTDLEAFARHARRVTIQPEE